jgi:hypothetical protein
MLMTLFVISWKIKHPRLDSQRRTIGISHNKERLMTEATTVDVIDRCHRHPRSAAASDYEAAW